MLGRAADNLFWLARNMERIENIARLLKTCRSANMLSGKEGGQPSVWEMPLVVSAQQAAFMDRYGELSDGRVLAFMLTDMDNPSSVRSLLANARENARATRHFLTSDLWECINRIWLAIKDLSYRDIAKTSIDEHLDWLIERSYMFKGVLAGSMRRGEGLHFLNLGICLERADNCARLLAVHFASADKSQSTMRTSDYYRSMALLNALNAYKAYRETFHSSIELVKIAELFILHKEVPRSLHACVYDIANILRSLNPATPVMKEVYDLKYRLETVQISQLRRVGLGHFLADFSKQMDQISLNIQQDFMMVQ